MAGAFQTTRDIFDNPIWQNIVEFRLFFLIYGKAAFTDGVRIGDIELKRGQWVRSYRNLQHDLEYMENNAIKRYSLATIKRAIDKLTKDGRLVSKTCEYGTLFEVVNYAKYQCLDNYTNGNLEQRENSNETATKQQRNNNKNAKNAKKEKNISNTDFSNHSFSETTKEKITEWITYKKEKRDTYTPTGLKSLLTQVEKNITTHGEQKIIDLIDECMAAGYKGIIWDRLKKPQNQGRPAHRDNFTQHNYDDDFYDKLQKIGG